MKQFGFRTWLLLAFLLLGLLPLAGVGVVFLQIYEKTLQEEIISNLQGIAEKKADQIDNFLQERHSNLERLSGRKELVDALDAFAAIAKRENLGDQAQEQLFSRLDNYLSDFVENGAFHDVLLIDAAGNVLYSVARESDLGTNLVVGAYRDSELAAGFSEALHLLQAIQTPFSAYAPSQGRQASFMVAPVLKLGRTIGALALQLNPDRFEWVATDATGLGRTGETVLAQKEGGQVIYTSHLRHIDGASRDVQIPLEKAPYSIKQALSGHSGQGVVHDYAGRLVVEAWRYLPALRWGMGVKIDIDEAFEPLTRMKRLTWSMLGLITVVIGLLCVAVGNMLAAPVKQLRDVTKRAAAGDLGVRAELAGPQELRELAASFNRMGDSLAELYTNLKMEIDERKCSETALAQTEERLRLAMEATSDGLWDWHIQTGGAYCNPAYYKMLGYEASDLNFDVDSLWLNLLHPEDRKPALVCTWKKAAVGSQYEQEFRMRAKDGSYHWILSRGQVVECDASGNPSRLVGTHIDLTERKKLEEAIVASEKEFRLLAEAMPQIVWITRADGWNIFLNHQWVDYTGLSLGESYGQGWTCPFHPEDRLRSTAAWQDALERHGSYSLECRLRRTDGVYRWWLLRGVPVTDESGSIYKWFGTFTDIHELKEALEELQSSKENVDLLNRALEQRAIQAEAACRAKSFFISNMSHEFRTPMNAILGYSEILRGKITDPKQSEQLAKVVASAKQLLAILNRILDFSEFESGRQSLQESDFSFHRLLKLIVDEYHEKAEIKGLSFSALIDPFVPEKLCGDATRLQHVLANLLDNALKFTATGSVRLRIKPIQINIYGVTLKFEIQDTGIGIETDKLQTIFEPFVQGDVSTTRAFGGTGMGLSISQKLVSMMGGEIGVESQLGQGSNFWFTASFKLGQVEYDEPEMPNTKEAEAPPPLTSSAPSENEQQLVTNLKKQLAEDNGEAIVTWLELKPLLQANSTPDQLAALERYIDQYDFPSALALLQNNLSP